MAAPLTAAPVLLDFETEDDFITPLINGQIVDPLFDAVDLEFGNLVELVMHFSLVDDDLTVGAGLSQEQLLS